jgi:hypothetical protein
MVMARSLLKKGLAGAGYKARYDMLVQRYVDEIGSLIPSTSPFHTDHGLGHIGRVVTNVEKLLGRNGASGLSPVSRYLILCACWCHDIGMLMNHYGGKDLSADEVRERHHELSAAFVREHYPLFGVRNTHVADLIADLCLAHRRRVDIARLFPGPDPVTLLDGQVPRRFLAGLLRLADALDCDERRAPEIDSRYIKTLPPESRKHWEACQLISGVDVRDGKIVIFAAAHSAKERRTLLWKLGDLYAEYESAAPFLDPAETGRLTGLVAEIRNRRTNKQTSLNVEAYVQAAETRRRADAPMRQRYFAELRQIWAGAGNLATKLQHSSSLLRRYAGHPFAENVDAGLVYLKTTILMEYKRGGACHVTHRFTVANVARRRISKETLTVWGVVQMAADEMNMVCRNPTTGEPMKYEYVNDTPLQKTIEYQFTPGLRPGEIRDVETHHVWRYPLPLSGPRWNNILVDCFQVQLQAEIRFPDDTRLGTALVFREQHPWVQQLRQAIRITRRRRAPSVIFGARLPLFDPENWVSYNINIGILPNVPRGPSARGRPLRRQRKHRP